MIDREQIRVALVRRCGAIAAPHHTAAGEFTGSPEQRIARAAYYACQALDVCASLEDRVCAMQSAAEWYTLTTIMSGLSGEALLVGNAIAFASSAIGDAIRYMERRAQQGWSMRSELSGQ